MSGAAAPPAPGTQVCISASKYAAIAFPSAMASCTSAGSVGRSRLRLDLEAHHVVGGGRLIGRRANGVSSRALAGQRHTRMIPNGAHNEPTAQKTRLLFNSQWTTCHYRCCCQQPFVRPDSLSPPDSRRQGLQFRIPSPMISGCRAKGGESTMDKKPRKGRNLKQPLLHRWSPPAPSITSAPALLTTTIRIISIQTLSDCPFSYNSFRFVTHDRPLSRACCRPPCIVHVVRPLSEESFSYLVVCLRPRWRWRFHAIIAEGIRILKKVR